MKHHHLAHLLDFQPGLLIGTQIERGQLLGRVGKTGTQYAHCHYEGTLIKPKKWTQYVDGISKDEVLKIYFDVRLYIDKENQIPCRYDTYGGYDFLDPIIDKSGKTIGFHPGVDINNGIGDADIGNPVMSPVDGEIAYIGTLEGARGNHIWIEEKEGHWSDEAMDWALDHKLIESRKNPNQTVSWGEQVVFARRLAQKVKQWSIEP